MTISMATNAHGAAATTLMPAPGVPASRSDVESDPQHSPRSEETPSSLSASVSCRRLSCQNTTATRCTTENGMIAETETHWRCYLRPTVQEAHPQPVRELSRPSAGVKLRSQKKSTPENRKEPVIQRTLQRARRCHGATVAPRNEARTPPTPPSIANRYVWRFDAVDIRERSPPPKCGDQQRQ